MFNSKVIYPDLPELGKVCKDVFNLNSIKTRICLRALMKKATYEAFLFALASSPDDGEAVVRLALANSETGENFEHELQPIEFQNWFPLSLLSISQLKKLVSFDKSLASQDWYGSQLMTLMLPNEDEYDVATARNFQEFASYEEKISLLKKMQQVADFLRPFKKDISLDFVISYHKVKLDRERRKCLLPTSSYFFDHLNERSETNVNLLIEYLNPSFRGEGPLAIFSNTPMNEGNRKPGYFEHQNNHLCQLISRYFPTPSLKDDYDLVESELSEIFMWKDAPQKVFTPYLNSEVVREIFEKVENLGHIPVDSNPEIVFCDFNKKVFPAESSVEIYCDFLNIRGGSVQVKLFQIDIINIHRKTKRNINDNIDLQGLVPHKELTIQIPSSMQLVREKFVLLNEKPISGCFVVEVVASGVAARAVIEKGSIDCFEHFEPYGHVFFPLQVDSNPRRTLDSNSQTIELWVEGKIFTPELKQSDDEDTRIIVPFIQANEPDAAEGPCTAVLSCIDQSGIKSHIFQFTRRKTSLKLNSVCFIDRESLLTGNPSAQIMVIPTLEIFGSNIPLKVLKNFRLTLSSTNNDQFATEEVFLIENTELNAPIVKFFKVIPKLSSIVCQLKGNWNDTEVSSESYIWSSINSQNHSRETFSIFLQP